MSRTTYSIADVILRLVTAAAVTAIVITAMYLAGNREPTSYVAMLVVWGVISLLLSSARKVIDNGIPFASICVICAAVLFYMDYLALVCPYYLPADFAFAVVLAATATLLLFISAGYFSTAGAPKHYAHWNFRSWSKIQKTVCLLAYVMALAMVFPILIRLATEAGPQFFWYKWHHPSAIK